MIDGLEILVAQGAASFERWTGMDGPREAMRAAVDHRHHMNPPAQTGAPPKSQEGQRGHHAVTARRFRPRAHGRDRRARLRRARGDGRGDRARQRTTARAPERLLLKDGTITDDQLARAVAERFGLDHVDLAVYRVDPDAAKLVTPAAVRRYQAVPVSFAGERTLLVAMADPANVLAADDIAVMTGYEVRPAVASAADIEQLLVRLEDPDFGNGAVAPRSRTTTIAELAAAAPVRAGRPMYELKRAGADQLRRPGRTPRSSSSCTGSSRRPSSAAPPTSTSSPATRTCASATGSTACSSEAAVIPASAVPAVVSRVKIMADLDIAERRIPQDGRISLEVAGKPIDLRVATLPTAYGEKVVMRILDQTQGHDRARAARHAAAGARALHQGVLARPTAPCS